MNKKSKKLYPKFIFKERLKKIFHIYEKTISIKNSVDSSWLGAAYYRYKNPVLTRNHIPPHWKYDLNPKTNPFLLERLGINAVFNPGAILHDNKIFLICRVEGYDRKSFFAIAESKNGIDGFKFIDKPIYIPENSPDETNWYDMRLTKHEDGWIYGLFCVEKKDPNAPLGDLSSAIAQCGIVRTKDLKKWERLSDLKTNSPQQRNVVLHPEFIGGKYAFYTRPQDSFIEAGRGGGIGWGLSDSIAPAIINEEKIIDPRLYHTIKEVKNGAGAVPLKTPKGWLHIAHGVRNTAAGLRYVLYAFLCDLHSPEKVIASPGGYFLAPLGIERVGDVSNVVFCNGIVALNDGTVLIYYASSDTRVHVAVSNIDVLIDYVMNTPEDPLRSFKSVEQRTKLIEKNLPFIKTKKFAK